MEDVFKTTDKYNRFNEAGHEILNPTPMQPPLGYVRQPSLAEQIREQVAALRRIEDNEPESEDEADDFDIDDDPPDPQSRWENGEMPTLKEAKRKAREIEAELQRMEKLNHAEGGVSPPPNKTSLPPEGSPQ